MSEDQNKNTITTPIFREFPYSRFQKIKAGLPIKRDEDTCRVIIKDHKIICSAAWSGVIFFIMTYEENFFEADNSGSAVVTTLEIDTNNYNGSIEMATKLANELLDAMAYPENKKEIYPYID